MTISEFRIKLVREEGIRQGFREGFRQGIRQGVREGTKQGVREGTKQGIRQGIKQGIEKNLADNIITVFEKGYSAESIADLFSQPLAKVAQIIATDEASRK
jgi:flagellar biosynthesis/type III secretory pathway protein FliH